MLITYLNAALFITYLCKFMHGLAGSVDPGNFRNSFNVAK